MFARHAGPYLVPTLGVSVLLFAVAVLLEGLWWLPAMLYLPIPLFVLWFFRDPERPIGSGIVSPADGRVMVAEQRADHAYLSIFMPPTGVHVNRSPVEGRIARTEYRRGGHVPAFRKESERNERFDMELATPKGSVRIGLIAGTVARRIHPYIEPGNVIKKGDRIGLIAFGSRCDLVLPGTGYRWKVRAGDKVLAAETTVAEEG